MRSLPVELTGMPCAGLSARSRRTQARLRAAIAPHQAVHPPSTTRFWPVMYCEASAARKTAAPFRSFLGQVAPVEHLNVDGDVRIVFDIFGDDQLLKIAGVLAGLAPRRRVESRIGPPLDGDLRSLFHRFRCRRDDHLDELDFLSYDLFDSLRGCRRTGRYSFSDNDFES